MRQSCNSERAGSHINRVKTLERIGLGTGTFNSLVFGTFNNAPLQELATPRLLAKWLEEGHMSGMTAGSADEGQSKVLKRHLEGKSQRLFTEQRRGACGLHSKQQTRVRCRPWGVGGRTRHQAPRAAARVRLRGYSESAMGDR